MHGSSWNWVDSVGVSIQSSWLWHALHWSRHSQEFQQLHCAASSLASYYSLEQPHTCWIVWCYQTTEMHVRKHGRLPFLANFCLLRHVIKESSSSLFRQENAEHKELRAQVELLVARYHQQHLRFTFFWITHTWSSWTAAIATSSWKEFVWHLEATTKDTVESVVVQKWTIDILNVPGWLLQQKQLIERRIQLWQDCRMLHSLVT